MPVTFNTAGAGSRLVQTGTSVSTSWSHTISTDSDNFVVVAMMVDWRGDVGTGVLLSGSATYGGQTMTLANPQRDGGSDRASSIQYITSVLYFYLADPPLGTQTVTVAAAATNNVYAITANSVAYRGVDFVATGYVGGDPASDPRKYAGPVGSMQVLLATAPSTITASNWTSRYTNGGAIAGHTTTFVAIGDATGTGAQYTPTYTPTPAAGSSTLIPIFQLYPAELSGNIRMACVGATEYGYAGASATFTHKTGVGNNLAAVLLIYQYLFAYNQTVALPSGVTYNGSAMTLLGTSGQYDVPGGLGTRSRVSLFGITNIAPGVGTVSVASLGIAQPSRVDGYYKELQLVTFRNVGSFGTPVQSTGNSTVAVSGPRSATILHAGTFAPSGLAQIVRAGGPSAFFDYYGGATLGIYETVSDTASLGPGAGVGVTLNDAPTGFFL